MDFVIARRNHRPEQLMIAPRRQIDELPGGSHLGWQFAKLDIRDQHPENTFVELGGEVKLLKAPARGKPRPAHQKQHRLAAVGRLVQRPLPAFAGDNPALRIEIEKNIVPAGRGKPIPQCHRCAVVNTRMAQKNPRQIRRLVQTKTTIRQSEIRTLSNCPRIAVGSGTGTRVLKSLSSLTEGSRGPWDDTEPLRERYLP